MKLHGIAGGVSKPMPAMRKVGAEQHEFRAGERGHIIADHACPSSAFHQREFHFAMEVPAFARAQHRTRASARIAMFDLLEIVPPAQQSKRLAGAGWDTLDMKRHVLPYWPQEFARQRKGRRK